jgi:arginine transport system substrate-binding protein
MSHVKDFIMIPNHRYSRLYCIFFVLISTLAFSSCGNKNNTSSNQLIVGMLPADAPFMSTNNDGVCEGFDVDIAHAIGDLLNKEIIIKEYNMAGLWTAFEFGKIDLMMCGLSITQARLEKFNMVHYQGSGLSTFPLVFWGAVLEGITSIEDLRGKNMTIAVLPGTTQEEFAQQFDFITLKTMGSYAEIILDLQYGKVNAALCDEGIEPMAKKIPNLQILQVPIGIFESRGHGIAINRKNAIIAAQVETAIDQLKSNGTIAALERRWGFIQEGNHA